MLIAVGGYLILVVCVVVCVCRVSFVGWFGMVDSRCFLDCLVFDLRGVAFRGSCAWVFPRFFASAWFV